MSIIAPPFTHDSAVRKVRLAGPAGLTLAAQLSAFPDIKTCIVDQKSGWMLLGQADGIACAR
jgi:hypothetical protein